MLYRKLSKWTCTAPNNSISSFQGTFWVMFVLVSLEVESAYHSKLSPEIHGTSILMERFHTRNHKSWNEPWESSNPTLPHFLVKEIQTQGIQYLPKITQLVSGTVRMSIFISAFSSLLFFLLHHQTSECQAEPTRDEASEVISTANYTHFMGSSSSETKFP